MLSLDCYGLSLLFVTILTGVSCEELTPVKNEESSLEDSTVTLSYTYSKLKLGDYFFWYRQYPGKPPEFIVSQTLKVSGLKIEVDQNQNQINLIISSAAEWEEGWTCLCVGVELREGVSCEELTPVKNGEPSLEDSTVTLSYTYSKQPTAGDYFFWYRQYPGKPPEFIISHSSLGKVGTFKISGLNIKVDQNQNQINLNISSAAVSHSAVYYCAVRPTVTGNT
ncbi:uncharacterized protein LOC141776586 [Sebastes fasciatus]|uniref:uncharacterized protein LOC141776586 n=1 Tax=Sebastes fasciatus TaxID=394691 RepID=UPI003D9EFA16